MRPARILLTGFVAALAIAATAPVSAFGAPPSSVVATGASVSSGSPVSAVVLRAPVSNSPHLATRMNAEMRSDIADAARAVRPRIPLGIAVVALLVVVWTGVRLLRRRYARTWAGRHLLLDVTALPATDFTLHAVRKGRRNVAAPGVVRLEIAGARATHATYAEVAT